jgi:hypothetical protein
LVYGTILDVKAYTCEFGVLKLEKNGETGSVSFAGYNFQKATDGSLVSSVSRTTFGLLVIVPYIEKSKTWLRWMPAQSELTRQSTGPLKATLLPSGDFQR